MENNEAIRNRVLDYVEGWYEGNGLTQPRCARRVVAFDVHPLKGVNHVQAGSVDVGRNFESLQLSGGIMNHEAIQALLKQYAVLAQWAYSLPSIFWLPWVHNRTWKRFVFIPVPFFARVSGWFIIGHIKTGLDNLVREMNVHLMLANTQEEKDWIEKQIKQIDPFQKSLPSMIIPKWISYVALALTAIWVSSVLPSAERVAVTDLVVSIVKLDIEKIFAAVQNPDLQQAIWPTLFTLVYFLGIIPGYFIGIFSIKRYAFHHPEGMLSNLSIQTIKQEFGQRSGVYELEKKAFREVDELQIDVLTLLLLSIIPFVISGVFFALWSNIHQGVYLWMGIFCVLIGWDAYAYPGIKNWHSRYKRPAHTG